LGNGDRHNFALEVALINGLDRPLLALQGKLILRLTGDLAAFNLPGATHHEDILSRFAHRFQGDK
jgi:hypothetical protein